MSRFRFVHAADLHLDTPFDGLARLGAGVPETLRDASLQAWDNLVAETLRVRASFLVLAGDIYDGPDRGLRGQLRFLDGLKRLSEAGVQVFLVHGNHDPLEDGWSAIRDWPAGVTVFGANTVDGQPVEIDGRHAVTVYGLSFPQRDTRDNLAKRFPAEKDGPFAIGVLHCNVGAHAEHAAYAPCDLSDLAASGMDYWALGHIHRHEVLRREDPCVVYPGVLQGRSPKPSEIGAKGAVVVEVDDNRVVDLTFKPLDVVRFESLEVDVGEIDDVAELQERLQTGALDLRSDAEDRQLILRATLTGRGPVHHDLRRSGRGSDDLLRELQETAGATSQVWWDRLIDRTAPPLDKDAIRERGDFSAELLQRADALLQDGEAAEAFLTEHCMPNDHRLRGVVGELDPSDHRLLLDQAADEALDRLERGEDV